MTASSLVGPRASGWPVRSGDWLVMFRPCVIAPWLQQRRSLHSLKQELFFVLEVRNSSAGVAVAINAQGSLELPQHGLSVYGLWLHLSHPCLSKAWLCPPTHALCVPDLICFHHIRTLSLPEAPTLAQPPPDWLVPVKVLFLDWGTRI